MSDAKVVSAITLAQSSAFIVRITWDSLAQRRTILVQRVDGEKRLFCNLEAAFFYIEMEILAQIETDVQNER